MDLSKQWLDTTKKYQKKGRLAWKDESIHQDNYLIGYTLIDEECNIIEDFAKANEFPNQNRWPILQLASDS